MSQILKNILNALSLSDLWKYVCNAMTCESDCCNHFITCSCMTSEIDIEEEDDKDSCTDLCLTVLRDAYEDSNQSLTTTGDGTEIEN